MAQQSARKVPQIRFKGFEDGWLESQLGERVEFFSGLTYSPRNVQKGVGTLVLRSSNVKKGEIVNADNVYVDPEIVNSKNVEVGDIAVVVRNGSRSLIGKHAQIKNRMDNTVIGAFMTGIHSENPAFTNALLDTPQFDKEIAKNLGATINQITTGAFRQMMFRFPRCTEQTQIGEYFRELDSLIGLHQRKHDKLVTLKKAMLQKMFPQPGTTTPEIRFKGFEGDWKPYELGDITTKIGSGKTPRGGKAGYLSIGIPLIRSQNIFSDSVNFEGIAFISDETDEEMSNSRVLQNDVLLNITGASIGRSAVYRSGERANVNQHVCIIRANGNHHADFIQLNLASTRGQAAIDNSQAGGAREGLNFQQIGKFSFQFPSHTEQTQIGTYFRTLDALISKHATQLQKLQQIKSACLEKMFV